MRIRGERTCRECGATWSYFETGSVDCPECGSPLSTGSGRRTHNTDRKAELDLQEARAMAAEDDVKSALRTAARSCLEYIRRRGFVDAGSLRDLDASYVYAQELRHTAVLGASFLELRPTERSYLLGLLDGTPADRPAPATVPDRLQAGRALGVASAVRDYRDDVRAWLEGRPENTECRKLLETLDEHRKRIHALDGDVPPSDAEHLLDAARAIGRYCREEDDATRESARTAIERLG